MDASNPILDRTTEKVAAANLAVTGAFSFLSAITLNEWVMIGTLVVIVLQIGQLGIKYYRDYKQWRQSKVQ